MIEDNKNDYFKISCSLGIELRGRMCIRTCNPCPEIPQGNVLISRVDRIFIPCLLMNNNKWILFVYGIQRKSFQSKQQNLPSPGLENFILLKMNEQTFKGFCINKSLPTEFSKFCMRLFSQRALALCCFQLACSLILLPTATAGTDPPAEAGDAFKLGGTSLFCVCVCLCARVILDLLYNCLVRKNPLSVSLLVHSNIVTININSSSWFPFTLFILGSKRKLLHGCTAL